jgi:hypothetical protein
MENRVHPLTHCSLKVLGSNEMLLLCSVMWSCLWIVWLCCLSLLLDKEPGAVVALWEQWWLIGSDTRL